MDPLAAARERLEQATGQPAILSAAYDAFEDMLVVIEDLQDPDGGGFAAFVTAGASAASGRDAVADAPSLAPVSPADAARVGAIPMPVNASMGDAASALARLSNLLTSRLADVGASVTDARDRSACVQASRYAAHICSLMGGVQSR